MIIITVPIHISDERLARFREQLVHLIKYHPDYIGKKFLLERIHISLVRINGNIERTLLSHIQEIIREYLGVLV
jgi:hypothetical protein